jgi:2-succinyl-6-hydroxy-2,4-cyclohexadiene-1-carboxylate synthase
MMWDMAPTVVLLHGFTHTGASWNPVIAALGERYRAIAPDLPGHGPAARQGGPVSLEAAIDRVASLAPDRFALAGYSMGGRIALHVALALGPQVTRLVLIGASPGLAEPRERDRRRQADDELAGEVERITIEAFADRWARTPVLAGQPEHVQAAVHQDRLRGNPAELARALRQLGTGALPSLWRRLPELTLPVDLVVGECDEKFTAIAAQMARELPNARVTVTPGAGHAVHLEAPEAVAAVIAGTSGPGRPRDRGRRAA